MLRAHEGKGRTVVPTPATPLASASLPSGGLRSPQHLLIDFCYQPRSTLPNLCSSCLCSYTFCVRCTSKHVPCRGDQNDSSVVDYFLTENLLAHFNQILQQRSNRRGNVATQVLQTLSILIQNVRNQQTVYYLFR